MLKYSLYVIISPHERKTAAELFGDLKSMRIKIQDLPTNTVVQWVDHRHDKPWACVKILASV